MHTQNYICIYDFTCDYINVPVKISMILIEMPMIICARTFMLCGRVRGGSTLIDRTRVRVRE